MSTAGSSFAVTPDRPGNAAAEHHHHHHHHHHPFSATPPTTSTQRSPQQQQAMTPEGAPPSGALDELRRKMLYRHKGAQGGVTGGGSSSTVISSSTSPGSSSGLVDNGGGGGVHPHPPPGSSPSSTPLNHNSSNAAGGAHESPEEQRPKDDAEEMRAALFQGRALPIRVVQGGDLRSDQDEASTDPHKLFQLLRKKKRATPSTSSRPFVPYQPPVVTTDSSNSNNEQSPEISSSVNGSSSITTTTTGHSPPPPTTGPAAESGGEGPLMMMQHTTPPRPQGTIPSRRPTNGRRASGDISSGMVGNNNGVGGIAPRPAQQQHSVSAPAGSSGEIIPPTALADTSATSATGGAVDRPASGGRPNSRIGSAAAKKREIQSAGLHGRPCTRQKHPKKALDLFDSSNGKKDEELFPKRRSSAPLGVVGAAGTPKAGAGVQASALVNSANPHGVTTVPSPNKPVGSTTSGGAGGAGETHAKGSESSVISPGTQAEQDVNFDCLFVREDEFGGEADAFPTAPKAKQANIPLIETDWFTTDSWEPLPCSDGHEVLECDTEDYAESLYELLKASTMRKSSFRK